MKVDRQSQHVHYQHGMHQVSQLPSRIDDSMEGMAWVPLDHFVLSNAAILTSSGVPTDVPATVGGELGSRAAIGLSITLKERK